MVPVFGWLSQGPVPVPSLGHGGCASASLLCWNLANRGAYWGLPRTWLTERAFCTPVLPSPSRDTSLHPLNHTTIHVGPWGAGVSLECLEDFPSPRSHGSLGPNFNVQLRPSHLHFLTNIFMTGTLNGVQKGSVFY
ncbi:hypothetical protein ILYODFUR_027648 [Ilyodon furcidens]|uniref:Uncharacterized protein n=1 Tax=Ilyodon furcidens TaxID=33524 RepID=A0ABV0UAQ2_9TELE